MTDTFFQLATKCELQHILFDLLQHQGGIIKYMGTSASYTGNENQPH